MTKQIRSAVCALICLCMIMSLAACGSTVKISEVEQRPLAAPTQNERDEITDTVTSGANGFAFRLSAALMAGTGDESFICSPFSVWLPLAALANATDAQGKDALLSTIGASGIAEQDINRATSRMLYGLTNERDAAYGEHYNPLKIANALFVGQHVTLKPSFAQLFADHYRGTAMQVNFSSPQAVGTINKWVCEQTDGLITNIVERFDPETITAIANAIYFSDRWFDEFNPDETTEAVFHAPSGDTAAMYMLREGYALPYYEDDKMQAMPLQFATNGGMYILLPKAGSAKALLATMTNDDFAKIKSEYTFATGKLLLPRFCIESDVSNLKSALEALGVPLFDDEAAPLSGGLIEQDMPVWVSDALQKAAIRVDEQGATAAAVTVIDEATAAADDDETEPFEMICDRPFAFILYGNSYGGMHQVLFTGVVNQP